MSPVWKKQYQNVATECDSSVCIHLITSCIDTGEIALTLERECLLWKVPRLTRNRRYILESKRPQRFRTGLYRPPGGAYLVNQAKISLCQNSLFFGFSTQ